MKHAIYVVLVMMLTFGANKSFGSAYDSHLQNRVDTEVVEFKRKIQSSNGKDLIEVLDQFAGAGSYDRETFELLEEKMKISYRKHMSNKKNSDEARILSALVRAYASTGYPESESWVTKLRDDSASRGVRNRAHRLIAKVHWYNVRNQIMNKADYYSPDQDIMTHRYLNLINSKVPTFMRWTAEEIHRRGGAESVVYDSMREIVKRDAHNYRGTTHLDAIAWFCKILNLYDRENSLALFESLAKSAKTHEKIKRNTKKIRQKPSGPVFPD